MDKELDLLLQKVELISMRADLLVEKSANKNKWAFTPVLAILLIAVLGSISVFTASIIQEFEEVEQNRIEAAQRLLLKASETGDSDQSIKNINFFIEAGLLRDEDGRIVRLLGEGEVPVIRKEY